MKRQQQQEQGIKIIAAPKNTEFANYWISKLLVYQDLC